LSQDPKVDLDTQCQPRFDRNAAVPRCHVYGRIVISSRSYN